ncbi:MAG: hypothetical protein QME90_09145 [Thermodesulfobacteriota bacterium]|nr:hypothetical protein [Thermodesulfobacteriota bacterium]
MRITSGNIPLFRFDVVGSAHDKVGGRSPVGCWTTDKEENMAPRREVEEARTPQEALISFYLKH